MAFLVGRVLEPDETIFIPRRAREERYGEMRAGRKSKVQPSQVCRRLSNPERLPTESYTPSAISHAVAVTCERTFPPPAPLAQQEGQTAKAWKVRLSADEKVQLAQLASIPTPARLRNEGAPRTGRRPRRFSWDTLVPT